MIKLNPREMKSISRILTAILCFAPLAYANAAGPVATTSGSNLTSYNPSTAYNNEWATMANGRTAPTPAPKADYGNCNSVILRCAQPKCSSGGCADMQIAAAIVSGCVQSNASCKQYGDDLVNYMTAQMVALSTAKVNEQNAQAAAAAAAAAAQNDRQTEQMAAMQQQMMQMQQQMAQQQAESAAQLQEALSQQAAQNAAALENMKTAATDAAMADQSGLTAYEREAISKGISLDALERQKVSGQILQKIEDAALSLKEVETAMRTAFEYAGCDRRGNGCSGPKRVKKWRELAQDVLDPYDNSVDKVYDALNDAIILGGIDLSDIYMMLDNSCNSWAQYMCPHMTDGEVVYDSTTNGKKTAPSICPQMTTENIDHCIETTCNYTEVSETVGNKVTTKREHDKACQEKCRIQSGCKPCTMLKVLDNKEEIYEAWIDTDVITKENTTVVACATGALLNAKLFKRKANMQNASGVPDIEELNTWLSQVEPNTKSKDEDAKDLYKYCNINTAQIGNTTVNGETILRKASLSKSLGTKPGEQLCVDMDERQENFTALVSTESETCPYINPIYAICDTHMYNIGQPENTTDSSLRDNMKEIVALKTTVISQQMYKQYEYLSATIRRIKTQLEKAVTTANLEAAGAKSDGSSTSRSGGLAGGKSQSTDKSLFLQGAVNCSMKFEFDDFVNCENSNINLINSYADSADRKDACRQLQTDVAAVNSRLNTEMDKDNKPQWSDKCKKYLDQEKDNPKGCGDSTRENIKSCAVEIMQKLSAAKRKLQQESQRYSNPWAPR